MTATLGQIVIPVLDTVTLIIVTDRAWLCRLGPLAERHASIQVGVDAPLHEPMVAYFDLHAAVPLIPARFLQTLVQPLQIPEVLRRIVLVAGHNLPDRIASLLVQITLALDALDAVGCEHPKINLFKLAKTSGSKSSYPIWTRRRTATGKSRANSMTSFCDVGRLHFVLR